MVIKKFSVGLILGASLLLTKTALATTYYVRTDGGTPTQCTGTTNAAYPGAGTNQPCALNHPVWVLGAPGTQGLWKGGDTLVLDDTDHATGAQAQYKIGLGMPNTVSANCYPNWSYNCVMSPVPSGPSPTQPTKIVGINYNNGCATKPQLWGTDGVNQIFDLSKATNVDMECLELTDHSNCGYEVGNPQCPMNWNSGSPSGPWGKTGVYAQTGGNLTFSNLDVHGFANRGFMIGGINGLTMSNVNMDGNYMSNFDGDVGESNNVSYDTGAIVLDHVKNRFAGCSEAYPRSTTFNAADYTNCTDQNDNPPGYGDGLGTYLTGGNWVITNSEFSHNTQDGLDLLYHDATGSVTIQKSLFEGNDGNQIKVQSSNTDIENSVIIGNCNYLMNAGKVKNTLSFVSCRAGGDAVVLSVAQGGTYKLYNNTIYAGGNSDVLVVDNMHTCNGTESYSFLNNIFTGNGNSSLYINQLGGACANPALATDYSIINNVSNNTCPSGGHNKCSTDPKWMEPISLTAATNLPNVYLQTTSPAVGTAEMIPGMSTLDFNDSSRGGIWDMGAIQNVVPNTIKFVPSNPTTTTITTTTTGGTVTFHPTTTSSVTPPSSTATYTPTYSGTSVTYNPATTSTAPASTSITSPSASTGTTVINSPTGSTTTTTTGNGGIVYSSTSSPTTVKISNGTVTFIKSKS